MNIRKRPGTWSVALRWLAAAGAAMSLVIPLGAHADHRSNGAGEVLVSAAVAYAVIGAAGGFRDHRHHHSHHHDRYRYDHHRHDRHRHGHHDRHRHDRHYWSARDQRHDYRYGHHARDRIEYRSRRNW